MTSDGDRRRPLLLGLTGNIACGKSTVLRQLAALGAATIDADEVYHDLIVPEAPLWHALRDRFGDAIIAPDGRIDRRALGALVFADPVALADLDRLTHPAVWSEVRRRLAEIEAPVIAVDAVKLIESGFAAECDRVWVVTCKEEQQVARLMGRNALARLEAEQRVAAQPPLPAKLARADLVIDNSGSVAATAAQVAEGWRALRVDGGV